MLRKSRNISLISVLDDTRRGTDAAHKRGGSGPLELSGRTKILIGLVGVRDRGIATRAIDAHTPRSDGAMVEHSDLLLAPFRIGEPLAGGRGYTLTECCITKILSKSAYFRNKNRPPAALSAFPAKTTLRAGAFSKLEQPNGRR